VEKWGASRRWAKSLVPTLCVAAHWPTRCVANILTDFARTADASTRSVLRVRDDAESL
jgi:hypothetical protein